MRSDLAYCRSCGYLLRGLEAPFCPECGASFDPGDPTTYRTPLEPQTSRPLRLVSEGAILLACVLILPRLFTGRTPRLLKSILGPRDDVILTVVVFSLAAIALFIALVLFAQERRAPLRFSLRTAVVLTAALAITSFLAGAIVHDFFGLRQGGVALFWIVPAVVTAFAAFLRLFPNRIPFSVACGGS